MKLVLKKGKFSVEKQPINSLNYGNLPTKTFQLYRVDLVKIYFRCLEFAHLKAMYWLTSHNK